MIIAAVDCRRDGPCRVIASPNPFSVERIERELPEGGTILEMMRATGCDKAMLGHAHVFIVDLEMTREPVPIPRENWARVRPNPGMLVSIRVVPTGGSGGGGGKNPLRTVLTIAVMVAAFYVGGAYGSTLATQFGFDATAKAFGSLTFGQVFGGATSLATPLVGTAVVNAVRAP